MNVQQIVDDILKEYKNGQLRYSYELEPLQASLVVHKLSLQGVKAKWKKNDFITSYHGVTIYINKSNINI